MFYVANQWKICIEVIYSQVLAQLGGTAITQLTKIVMPPFCNLYNKL